MKFYQKLAWILVVCLVVSISMPVKPVYAATVWKVNSTDDVSDSVCDAHCTLREAIELSASGDTIIFNSHLSGATIHLSSTLIIDSSITIDGSALSQPIIISGDNAVRVFQIYPDYDVTMIGISIVRGHAVNEGGGGIYIGDSSLSLIEVNFANNYADAGGGAIQFLMEEAPHTLSINSCTFTNNATNDYAYGGAVEVYGSLSVLDSEFVDNYAGHAGGAISLYSYGSSRISKSTFAGNVTDNKGGALYYMNGVLNIANSTFYDNSAYVGGGIMVWQNGVLNLRNSTLSHNNPSNLYGASGETHIYNSIFANVVGGIYDCHKNSGSIVTSQNAIIERNGSPYFSCGTPISSADPQLGPLTNNGGLTRTMAISATSPALDTGDNASCPSIDQRGYTRPVDGDGDHSSVCDIGAYELQ